MTPSIQNFLQKRLLQVAYWIVPTLFFLWVYRYGLKSWFMADDFAWLVLTQRVFNFQDFLRMMFEPMAQGTIRPWSERGFFLLFRTLFDLDGVPYRVCVFATMALNLVLISAVTYRILRSRLAAFLAPLLWTVNETLITVMTWNSAYNEAQCAAFLLGALLLFIRYAETGRRWLYFWSIFVFALGFGSLEINIVFPAVALAYAVCAGTAEKRKSLALATVPMWVLSLVYYGIHRAFAPFLANGPYALHVDSRMFRTLLKYLKWSLIPATWDDMNYKHWLGSGIVWLLAAFLIGYLVYSARNRDWKPFFFAGWFLATIGPMVPLPDHISDYYLTIPTIGIAMLFAGAIACGWDAVPVRTFTPWKLAAVVCAAAYVGAMLPTTRFATRWWYERTRTVKGIVLGVRAARQAHPGKAILLDGVTSETYNDAIGHSPFILLGANDVYLVPQLRDKIHPANDVADLDDTILAPGPTLKALLNEQALVYSVAGDHLRNITRTYGVAARLSLQPGEPRRIDAGNPLFAYLLGPEWLPIDNGFRWMPKRATLRLAGPGTAKDQLFLEGICPLEKLGGGSVHLEVSVDGIPLKGTNISDPESSFHRLFKLPPELIGRPVVEVAIQTDRLVRTSSQGELGLAFGKIAIRAAE